MPDNDLLILIVLAVVAGFLLLRLRNVLGERTGFEDPEQYSQRKKQPDGNGGVVVPMPQRDAAPDDSDIFAYAEPDSALGQNLQKIKRAEPDFNVQEFVDGSKRAYEMLLVAFEAGDVETLRTFLAPDVFTPFSEAIEHRKREGLSVDMRFVGIRSAEPTEASYDEDTGRAEITMRFAAEVITATRNARGEIVAGDPSAVQRTAHVWTFARTIGSDDPNWVLSATSDR